MARFSQELKDAVQISLSKAYKS